MRNVSHNYVSCRNRPGTCPASVLFSHTYDSYGNVLTETVPYVTGLPLCRSYDELQRPSGVRLGEADCDYTYICFNNDAVRCIRRISTTAESIKLEFAMGAWANRANLTYQPLNTTFRYNGIDYDDFGRPASHPHYKKHRERLAPYLVLADSGYRVGYSYDEASRLAAVAAFGQSAAYTRMPGANRLTLTVFKNGNTPIHAAFRTYDDFNRLTGINGYGYTLNDKDQRTKLTLTDNATWDYTYDGFSQVIGGVKKDGATELANHAYTYDQIGNRVTATTGAAITEYTANLLNQYTAIDEEVPTYDLDGNMLTNGEWTYTWNIENRLTAAENATTKLEFAYDFMGRRTTKKVYAKSGTTWTLQTTKTFVYDGFKQIAELTDNAVTMHTVWQPASSGDYDAPLWTKTGTTVQVYVLDGNKNIRQLKDTTGTVIANYDYDPFGNVSSTGTVTPWQFSSEYRDDETGLIYYNYRYYDPRLGRWTKRDPIGEEGGMNLYGMIGNNTLTSYDDYGWGCCGKDITKVLNRLLLRTANELMKKEYVFLVYNESMFAIDAGWDIMEFYESKREIWEGASGDCAASATYNGSCYKMAHLNYALWGLLAVIKQHHVDNNLSWYHHLFMSSSMYFPIEKHRSIAWSYTHIMKLVPGVHNEPEEVWDAAAKKMSFFNSGLNFFDNYELKNSVANYIDCEAREDDEYTGNLHACIKVGGSKYLVIPADGAISYESQRP